MTEPKTRLFSPAIREQHRIEDRAERRRHEILFHTQSALPNWVIDAFAELAPSVSDIDYQCAFCSADAGGSPDDHPADCAWGVAKRAIGIQLRES